MVAVSKKVKVRHSCMHCGHEWEQFMTAEEIKKMVNGEPFAYCPDEKCGLPT